MLLTNETEAVNEIISALGLKRDEFKILKTTKESITVANVNPSTGLVIVHQIVKKPNSAYWIKTDRVQPQTQKTDGSVNNLEDLVKAFKESSGFR